LGNGNEEVILVHRVLNFTVSLFLLNAVPLFSGSPGRQEGARYLIIAPDSYYDYLVPLAEWKTKKGMKAKIATLSETGSSPSEIRSYIQNAYTNWDPRPEYVVIAASANIISMPYYNGAYSDNYYTNMDGDVYNEIIPGRLPARNTTEMQVIVEKILSYERYPYLDDTLWFKSATLIIREDGDSDDTLYWGDKYLVAGYLYSTGYTRIDTFSYFQGDNGSDVAAAINEGRSIVNFRGQSTCMWWSPFNVTPENLTNGYKLPIITSPTCDQIDPSNSNCGERWVRAGSPGDLKGGVAFVGQTTVLLGGAYLRSAIDRGFYIYLFEGSGDSIPTFGKACEAGRRKVYEDYGSVSEFNGCVAIGDPELNIRTRIPRELFVTHPSTIPPGSTTFEVLVSNAPYALVCVMTDSTVYEYGYTDRHGHISFQISPEPYDDTLFVTVTARDALPYEGFALIIPQGPYLSYVSHYVEDFNNEINPSDTVSLFISVANLGTEQALDVYGVLETNDPYVTIIDSEGAFGNIAPSDTVTSIDPFRLAISSIAPSGHTIDFTLNLYDSLGNEWVSHFTDTVRVPILTYLSYSSTDTIGGDGDGVVEPGEEVELRIILRNTGMGYADSVWGVLSSLSPYLTILTDSVGFSDAPPGYSSNSLSSFILDVSPSCPYPYTGQLVIASGYGAFSSTDTFDFIVGPVEFFDDMEGGEGDWTHYAITEGYQDEWYLSQGERYHSGSHAWKCGTPGGTYSNFLDAGLESPTVFLLSGSKLTFWYWIEAETSYAYEGYAYDGGIVEISTDGQNWEEITPTDGYPFKIRGGSNNPLPAETPCFSGLRDWRKVEFDLSNYTGSVSIRFRFATDQAVRREGWYVDDVYIGNGNVADIDLSSWEFEFLLPPSGDTSFSLTIFNRGEDTLSFQISPDSSWLQSSPSNGLLPPSSSTDILVSINGAGLEPGTYRGGLTVSSNDPDEGLTYVAINLVTYCEPGDANADGVVDRQDLSVLIDYLFFGGESPTICGDYNSDGVVDFEDLTGISYFLGQGVEREERVRALR